MPDPASPRRACAACGAETREDARFCPQCGTRLEGDDTPSAATRTVDVAVSLAQSERRVFGLAPPELVLALAFLAAVLGACALVLGRWISGAVLLLLAAAFGRFFAWTARRLPDGRVAQLATGASDAARAHAGFAWVSVSSWSSAGLTVLRLRREQQRLWRAQRQLIDALGDAVFRNDDDEAEGLKAKARACADRLDELAKEELLVLAAAHDRVARERVAVAPTERLAPNEAESLHASTPRQT